MKALKLTPLAERIRNDTILFSGFQTGMTPLDTSVVKEPVSATRMTPFFYLVWVMQEV
ncbi:hypothetical protein MGE33_05680 [Wolbachia pipientis]|uniref:hypothetical protein n=1 Tax=Wolbachia TaxID=953 RepID=UPI0019356101|nr:MULTISPECIES: hypothetical protein [Wolbachia]MCE4149145.1 hypothetical protein [Wolbachia endosymbiont of Drosophila melanogaster]QQL98910.1 hypothetical protein GQX69_05545 [Wolbachia endosymbiont of Drosophila melanogaster]QQM01271.1 hypothetical protein GQX67_05615 [Wolbachia endosymbiont of Drosophila melanogaster]UJA58017.1 hypothetical protein L0Z57_05715 [Wolbachia endosymbiont of Aedes aegypti]UJA63651.1 hypothetical protein L0Z60_05715 [Wolbachia endosymbiont of Aedes aegypti]